MTTIAGSTIRPFEVHVPGEDLTDLRRRIGATRWAARELVKDRSQGVQLAAIQELARYWAADYDWGRCEARLNALPQFKTEIDGVDIHFIHVKSPHADALPLIITHGWPGSVIEMLEVVGPLTDPAAHGSSAGDAFDLVLPSMPGYGFSAGPAEVGWDPGRIARAWAELMRRLGYTQALAAGQAPPQVTLPVGFTMFPGEIFQAPRSWAEKLYPNLSYFHEADRGGHFAAWEEPQLFSEEVRASFRPLR